jgi:L-fucose isomerase-like protein
MPKTTLALLVGNRGFFPAHLCESGRREMLAVLEQAGFDVVALPPDRTPSGGIESLEDARQAAAHFRTHADRIDGVVVTLPNFGDERAVADTLRWSGLRVPVLVHAFPDQAAKMTSTDRRDGFCGKMSVCNNLRQYGIPFTLPRRHTDAPTSATFARDLSDFGAVCRVARALRGLRVGALGARPAAFNTVRYSEKLLEKHGISVETLDLSECIGRAGRLPDDAASVRTKLEAIKQYVRTRGVPPEALLKMAKLGVVIDEWTEAAALDATAIQCWTALEEFYGVVPCTLMSMLSNALRPSACEVDVPGAVAMTILARASIRPAALLDWNNNYGDDPDKGVVFHCSNLPKDIFAGGGAETAMDYQAIIAGTVGQENSYGTIAGRMAPGAFTYLRVATDDTAGKMRAYVGEGELTDDPLLTFGGYGVVRVPDFQRLLRYICENGFEHHVAITPGLVADAVAEALGKYAGWDVYRHG